MPWVLLYFCCIKLLVFFNIAQAVDVQQHLLGQLQVKVQVLEEVAGEGCTVYKNVDAVIPPSKEQANSSNFNLLLGYKIKIRINVQKKKMIK